MGENVKKIFGNAKRMKKSIDVVDFMMYHKNIKTFLEGAL